VYFHYFVIIQLTPIVFALKAKSSWQTKQTNNPKSTEFNRLFEIKRQMFERRAEKMKPIMVIIIVLAMTLFPSLTLPSDLSDLQKAIESLNADAVKKILDEGVGVNTKRAFDGFTPLMIAAQNGATEIGQMLINRGARVDEPSVLDETALTLAIEHNDLAFVNMLLRNGAKVNYRTKLDQTPLLIAAGKGFTQIARELIAHGANIEADILNGKTTPLIKAAARGYLEIVRMLLEKNARINAKEKGIWTALMLASQNGFTDVVKLLIERGADVNARTALDETALMYAVENNHYPIAELLVENKADVNAADKYQKTALMRAAAMGNMKLTKLLISHGANINQATDNGWSPLMFAIKSLHYDFARSFIKMGADTSIKSNKGETALSLAKRNKADLLILYEVPPEPKDGPEAIQAELDYPRSARRARVQGIVQVKVHIDSTGEVLETQIAKSFGNKECDQAAMDAVQRVEWLPAVDEGKRLAVWIDVPVEFKLDEPGQ
jgi:TonB family protein